MLHTDPDRRSAHPEPAADSPTPGPDAAGPLLPDAKLADALAFLSDVVAPTLAMGPIIRRRRMVALAERHDLVGRSVRRMQDLHERYGDGPLLIRTPVRTQAVVLAPEHVHRVLRESPDPFAPDSGEKVASLSHFQPKAVLISRGEERADRRRFNEEVLDTGRPMHRLSERFREVVEGETREMLGEARRRGVLDWDVFGDAWFRVVRRVTLGDAARDDREFTRMHERLRAYANLAFLQPKRRELRARFFDRLNHYLDRAQPDSLASVMAATHTTDVTAASHQVPHWLFAFDPAGMTTFRTLALLTAHVEHDHRAREEIARQDRDPALPFLRMCVLDTLRLWPTTPMILRQTRGPTEWDGGVMPPDTGVLVFPPFFHRDDRHLAFANRFAPDVWAKERTSDDPPLIPFSEGPVGCPAQWLVLMLTSTMLAEMLRSSRFREVSGKVWATHPMPSMLDNYGLRFELLPPGGRGGATSTATTATSVTATSAQSAGS